MARRVTTTITSISKVSSHVEDRASALVVIYGADLGKKFDLTEKKLTIGRASKCDVQVDQESVSRTHAVLTNDRGRVTVRDDGSTNGTFVNDEEIEGDFKLRNGDFIKIGRTIFKFIAGNNIEATYHDTVYKLTTIDGLTQVFNRRYFEDALERELARALRHQRALSLVMIDIDYFKKINDTHGHLAGDAVLKDVASVIKGRTRREDVLSRFGGEEFALLLPEIEQKNAIALAEKLRKLVEKHQFTFDKTDIRVTVSAGAASAMPKDEPNELVKRADELLYEAKKAGRNRVIG